MSWIAYGFRILKVTSGEWQAYENRKFGIHGDGFRGHDVDCGVREDKEVES